MVKNILIHQMFHVKTFLKSIEIKLGVKGGEMDILKAIFLFLKSAF